MKYNVLIIYSRDTDRFSCRTQFKVFSVYPEEDWIINYEFILILHVLICYDIKANYNPGG